MWFETKLVDLLALRYPLIQAPMAGGPTTPELVSAVSAAGGLGTLGVGYQSPDTIRADIRRVRALTDRPFGANLLMTKYLPPTATQLAAANERLGPFRRELGLGDPPVPERFAEDFDEQVAVLLEERVPVISFAFGVPTPAVISAFKRQGALLLGTATTVAEALRLEAVGFDVVVAQGAEAGGHRGTFLGPFEAAMIGTLALVPQIVDAVGIPVVAAGGIMDGRGILAALALGALGVQMGTAFMLCPESGTSAPHRAAIVQSTDDTTCITRAYSGRPVRAIENRFIREMRPHERDVAAYPIQNALTRELRREATAQGKTDLMGMWAGQGSRLARALPAAELIQTWVAQVDALIRGFKS